MHIFKDSHKLQWIKQTDPRIDPVIINKSQSHSVLLDFVEYACKRDDEGFKTFKDSFS